MILKTLSPSQTEIWINNLDKLATLYNTIQKSYREARQKREEQFKQHYGNSFFKVMWIEADEFGDVIVTREGKHITIGYIFGSTLKKIDDYSTVEMKVRKLVLNAWIGDGRKEIITRLINTWSRYAEKPFQIESTDLETYYNILSWHEELKVLAIELGIYDEALNLDEDCV